MADFLLKNTNHWMDTLSDEEVQQRIVQDPSFEQAYSTRYQKGDVIEVGPDNRWKDHQHGNGKFIIVRAPFCSLEEAETYMESDDSTYRRRYRMWFENITDEQLQSHQISPYVYQLNNVSEMFIFSQDKKREPVESVD